MIYVLVFASKQAIMNAGHVQNFGSCGRASELKFFIFHNKMNVFSPNWCKLRHRILVKPFLIMSIMSMRMERGERGEIQNKIVNH